MPMRLGEMVLIIRTQDYASRNLNRVAQNLGKLSKMQSLQRQQQMQSIRRDRLLARQGDFRGDISMLQRRLTVENALLDISERRRMEARRLQNLQARTTATGQLRGPGGRFMGAAAPHLAAAAAQVARFEAAEKALLKVHGSVLDEMAATRPALARMGSEAAAARLARLTTALGLVDRQLHIVNNDLTITQHALNQMRWQKLHDAGAIVSRFGRIAQLTGLVVTGSFVAMGNKAADFSASATLAATQARNLGGDTVDALTKSKTIQAAVIDQMQKYPVAAQDMTAATYEIFSSLDLMNNKGIVNTSKGLHILDLANKAAVAGGVDLAGSIQGIIITLNNFDPGLQHVNSTLNTMFDIVRFGNIHFSDLTTVLGKVAPAAKSVGFSLEDVSGAIAQATRTLPSGMVAAGFSQLMRVFADPNFQEGIRVASKLRLGKVIDIAPGGKLEKPLEILRDILEIFPELAKGGQETAGFFRDVTKAGKFALTGRKTEGREFTIQIRRVFETLIQNFSSVEELQAAIQANNGELGKSFATMMKDPGVQWKLFLSQLQAFVLIVGQAALPALLDLADGIQRIVQWFQNLSPHTRRVLVEIGVFGGAIALVVGIMSSFIGGLVQIASSLGMMGKGVGIFAMLARSAAILAGVGVIALILKTAVTGDASAWDFIQGALYGAAAGFAMFGPAGAVIGGITVPIILEVIRKKPIAFGGVPVPEGTPAQVRKAYAKYLKSVSGTEKLIQGGLGSFLSGVRSKISGKQQIMGFEAWLKLHPKFALMTATLQKNKKETKSWGDTLRNAFSDAKSRAASKAYDEFLKKIGMGSSETNKAAQAAKDHAEAVNQATKNMAQTVKTAAGNLANMYDQLREQNEAAMKPLFQGPTMSGILGNVFSGINDTLRQFGVQIPVPFEILKQDMDQSVKYFKRWRSDINKLLKAGVPIEMVQQLQEMGPDQGISIAEGFLSGSKAGQKSFIKAWKLREKLVDKATKDDMNNKLKLWNSYGKDAAWATIMGIINNPRNHKITKMYETYVKNTYSAPLKKAFQDDVAQYMINAQRIAAAAAQNMPNFPGLGGTGNTNPLTFAQRLQRQQRRAQSTITGLQNFVGPLSPLQQQQLRTARRRRRMAAYELAALPSVKREMAAQHGRPTYHITYHGDTVNIKADGATTESVTRALAKSHFHKKTKNTRPKGHPPPYSSG